MKNTHYFFDDIINIKNFDPNDGKVKIFSKNKSAKIHTNFFFFFSYVEYVTIKDLKYVKSISVNSLYLIIRKMNG